MKIEFIANPDYKIAFLSGTNSQIETAQDALEVLMNCRYSDTNRLIITEDHLSKDFFELKTGLAGEMLQKFSTYDGYLAIIGDFTRYQSRSLSQFIYESNRLKRINFVATWNDAISVLTQV